MRNTQARIGKILLSAGVLILLIQLALLIFGDGKVVAHRAEVLRGDVEYAGGAHDVRPLFSVLGVLCVTGGLFTIALSGNAETARQNRVLPTPE